MTHALCFESLLGQVVDYNSLNISVVDVLVLDRLGWADNFLGNEEHLYASRKKKC